MESLMQDDSTLSLEPIFRPMVVRRGCLITIVSLPSNGDL
jgi:hypothetical protein